MGQDTTPYDPESYQKALRSSEEAKAKAEHEAKVEALAREIFLKLNMEECLIETTGRLVDISIRCRLLAYTFYSQQALVSGKEIQQVDELLKELNVPVSTAFKAWKL
jgi:hypothetical protein